ASVPWSAAGRRSPVRIWAVPPPGVGAGGMAQNADDLGKPGRRRAPMGGFGSGRWGWHPKADTVEDCRTLDLSMLARDGAFPPWHTGTVRWRRGEQETAAIGYSVHPRGGGLALLLSYRRTPACGTGGENVDLWVRLETTPLHFGGVRWWGVCPLSV